MVSRRIESQPPPPPPPPHVRSRVKPHTIPYLRPRARGSGGALPGETDRQVVNSTATHRQSPCGRESWRRGTQVSLMVGGGGYCDHLDELCSAARHVHSQGTCFHRTSHKPRFHSILNPIDLGTPPWPPIVVMKPCRSYSIPSRHWLGRFCTRHKAKQISQPFLGPGSP